jgi:hypothetical protein
MFHIVDDNEWEDTIACIAKSLNKNGHFIVGGHFGYLDGLNVQIDQEGNINKRLRSRMRWKKNLKEGGFRKVLIKNNKSYLFIEDKLPENNILIGVK